MREISLSDYIYSRAKRRNQTQVKYFKRRAKVIDELIKAGSVNFFTHSIKIIEHITPKCHYRYAYFACPICAKKCRKLFLNDKGILCFVCGKINYASLNHNITRLLFYHSRDKNQRKHLKNIKKKIRVKDRAIDYFINRK